MPADDAVPDDQTVVQEAAAAAERVIFSRYDQGDVRDFDVTVSFEDGLFEVDVYLDAPGDAEQVANDAMLAARQTADELLT